MKSTLTLILALTLSAATAQNISNDTREKFTADTVEFADATQQTTAVMVVKSQRYVSGLENFNSIIAAPGFSKYIKVLAVEVGMNTNSLDVGPEDLNFGYSSTITSDPVAYLSNATVETDHSAAVFTATIRDETVVKDNEAFGVQLSGSAAPLSGTGQFDFTITYMILSNNVTPLP